MTFKLTTIRCIFASINHRGGTWCCLNAWQCIHNSLYRWCFRYICSKAWWQLLPDYFQPGMIKKSSHCVYITWSWCNDKEQLHIVRVRNVSGFLYASPTLATAVREQQLIRQVVRIILARRSWQIDRHSFFFTRRCR